MHLVKWLRRNNKKLMAVVVIVIMIVFTVGPALRYFSQRTTGLHRTVAWLGDNKKITNRDLVLAQQELEILKLLQADNILRSIGVPLFGRTPDLQAVLLGELLFSERRISPQLINRIKQIIRVNGYRISDKQINDIYRGPQTPNNAFGDARRSMPGHIYWLLLKNEAQLAGIRISNDSAGKVLTTRIPELFNGATYSQLIGSLINQRGIPEKEILTTFGKLLAVLSYAGMVCSSEDVTARQIMYNVSLEEETIDVEIVRFDSAVFAKVGAETQGQPTQQQLSEHFDRYKKFFAGAVGEENPYSFGYKLPDRVKLEYIAVNLDDISAIVTAPPQEEAEVYYQKHIEQFTEQVPSDPNDPNSPLIERTRSYAEVANIISKSLLQERVNSRAERILQEAKTLTEAGSQDMDTEPANLSAEPRPLKTGRDEQFKQIGGDYETAAEELTKKHKINVYTGQTGLLSAADIQADEYLGRLYLEGYGYDLVRFPNIVWLHHTVFAIDELKASELGPFDVPKPRMYENIGPVKDIFGQIMAVVRVTEAKKPTEPESINQTFSKIGLRIKQTEEQAGEDIYSVKEKVVEDLKKLAAMDTAKAAAEEFNALAVKDGWEAAIDRFNELYGQQAKADVRDPNVFRLQNLTDLRRISRETIETLAVQSAGNPGAQLLVNRAKKDSQFIDQLYSLVPQDANTVDTVPLILEFKPDMSYYCLKNILVRRINQDEYERVKVLGAYKEDIAQYQSLAPVHFSPENILKRMNFRWARDE